MTGQEHAVLWAYIREAADAMLLRDWEIVLDTDPCDDNSMARCSVQDGQREAKISVNTRFLEYAPSEQRECVAHELVHCLVDGPWRVVLALDDVIGSAAFSIVEKAYEQQEELAVDALGKIIAQGLPLIEWRRR